MVKPSGWMLHRNAVRIHLSSPPGPVSLRLSCLNLASWKGFQRKLGYLNGQTLKYDAAQERCADPSAKSIVAGQPTTELSKCGSLERISTKI